MPGRKKVPATIQAAVLTRSGRRCAICFGLSGDLAEKKGQIAHLDRDPRNAGEDNLVFLCLNHHDDYDSRTSQSKGFSPDEVKTYRDRLYEALRLGPSVASGNRHSEERRQALLEILGDIAPDILTILNIAPTVTDRNELARQMKMLHKRLERFRPLFRDAPEAKTAITRMGNLGGSSVSPHFPMSSRVFDIYNEDVSTLEAALAREENLDKRSPQPGVPTETIRVLPKASECRWNKGSISDEPAMHVVGRWHVTNITKNPVFLLRARLVEPSTEGQVATKHPSKSVFGDYPIPAGMTTEVDSDFWIVPPVRESGENLGASVILTDQYGNDHQTERVLFRGPRSSKPTRMGPPKEAIHSIADPIEKEVASVLKAEVDRYRECGRRVGGLGSIRTRIGGQTHRGIGTEWREVGSPDNQAIVADVDKVAILSDNADALVSLYNKLKREQERAKFVQSLTKRLSRDTEYAPVGYLILYVLLSAGRFSEALEVAGQKLRGDDAHGFSDFLRFLDGLLRLGHTLFSPEMLDDVERFTGGLDEYTFSIGERLAAIRAFRLGGKG